MDGYLSKPISAVSLEKIVREFSRPQSVGPIALELSFDAPAADGLPVFDFASALERIGHDVELLSELVEDFLQRQDTDLARIQAACSEHDWEQAVKAIHTLRGSALSIGAASLKSCTIAR